MLTLRLLEVKTSKKASPVEMPFRLSLIVAKNQKVKRAPSCIVNGRPTGGPNPGPNSETACR